MLPVPHGQPSGSVTITKLSGFLLWVLPKKVKKILISALGARRARETIFFGGLKYTVVQVGPMHDANYAVCGFLAAVSIP